MMDINPEILTESKFAREDHLLKIDQNKAQELLAKAKAMVWAMWQGTAIATTEQMAEFYEVPNDTVQTAIKNHRAEFESDGLKVLRGKALKDVVSKLDTTSKVPSLTAWKKLDQVEADGKLDELFAIASETFSKGDRL